MGLINLENIEAGMVLAAEAKARNGRVLLPAGATVTEKHLGIFKAWGVTEADIQGVTRRDVPPRPRRSLTPAPWSGPGASSRSASATWTPPIPSWKSCGASASCGPPRRSRTGEADGP